MHAVTRRSCAGKQELFKEQAPQVLETLRQAAIIQSTESSNRIEGIIDMTQVSHPRRTRILPPSPIAASEKHRRQEQRNTLASRCRPIFDRLRPQLIDVHYNWHIAIDPDTEQYLLDPTLSGITQKIREVYSNTDEVKLTIFRLNDTGTCGRLWV